MPALWPMNTPTEETMAKKPKPKKKAAQTPALAAGKTPNGKCQAVPGCQRPAAPGKGGSAVDCQMHYQRWRRTGSYGEAEATRSTDGAVKTEQIKSWHPDGTTERIRKVAAAVDLSSVSEWVGLVIEKELIAAERRALKRNAAPAA